MKETDQSKKLRKHIYAQLKNITESNSPFIYAAIQTKEGYADIEMKIIKTAIREKMPVQAVLPHVENELSAN